MGIKIMKNQISFKYTVSKDKFKALTVEVSIDQTSLTDLDVLVKVIGSTPDGTESVNLTLTANQFKFSGKLIGSVKVDGNLNLKGVDYGVNFKNKFEFTEEDIREIYSPENICKIIDMVQSISSIEEIINSAKSKYAPKKKSRSRHGNHVHVVPVKDKKEEVWGEL